MDQEHRSRLGAQLDDVSRAIVFLVLSCALVLLDDIDIVLIDRESAGDACLHVCLPLQPVHV